MLAVDLGRRLSDLPVPCAGLGMCGHRDDTALSLALCCPPPGLKAGPQSERSRVIPSAMADVLCGSARHACSVGGVHAGSEVHSEKCSSMRGPCWLSMKPPSWPARRNAICWNP